MSATLHDPRGGSRNVNGVPRSVSDVSGPTDAEIEATLNAAPEERWTELAAAADAVEAEPPHEHVRWAGGELVDGARQMPYPVYSAAVERLLSALGQVGAVVVFPWPQWDGAARYRDPTAFATAPAADVARYVTSVMRAERFGDGVIANEVASGRLVAAARRLVTWRAEAPIHLP